MTRQHDFLGALARGDLSRVRQLAGAGADVNAPIAGPGGETPLIRAVTSGNEAMVRLLLELGADPSRPCRGQRCWTPLMFAHENPALLRLLAEAGASLNARTEPQWIRSPSGGMKQLPGGETALHLAAAAGNPEAVRALIEAGAEVEPRADDGNTPLDYAIRQGSVTPAAVALVEAGAQLTPERLAAMHSGAHRPDSDVAVFPWVHEAAPPVAEPRPPANPPGSLHEPDTASEACRCPVCNTLLYSRRSKMCGQCGALLPPELVVTDIEAQHRHEERRWARELANKFSPQPAVRPPGSRQTGSDPRAPAATPEELLRRLSCAQEFKGRERPGFGLHMAAYSVVLSGIVFAAFQLPITSPAVWIMIATFYGLACGSAWRNASPLCPNCRLNIKHCAAVYCHSCGLPLKQQRCETCSVDNSWLSIFRQRGGGGYQGCIVYCPGCGVYLDSKLSRWGLRRR